MKKPNLLLSCFFLVFSNVFLCAQDTTQFKRAPYKLIVAVDKETFYEESLNESFFILPNRTVQIYSGETVFIEIDQVDGIIKNMTAVKEIKYPSKTLSITFTQALKNKAHESMTLKISNPFKYQLSYKATIFLLKNKKWVKTNVYPVEAELMSYEIWPDIITSIGLGDLSFKK